MAAACVDVLSPPKPPTDEAPTGVAVAAVEFADVEGEMILHSAEIKRTAMYLGLFAFVVYAVLRGRRVEIILGDHVSDILHAYAAWAWGGRAAVRAAARGGVLPDFHRDHCRH